MPRSISRRALRAGVLVACALLCAAAVVFYLDQNASSRIGGPVAPQKLAWLFCAILLWIVLPAAIQLDARSAGVVRLAFGILLLLMLGRGAIELRMLYVTRNWSPWYGIAHDASCLAVLAACGLQAIRRGVWRHAPNGLLLAHLGVTALAFLPEIYFAHYMVQNFDTAGDAAVYFVPADARHREVLGVTTAVVIALGVYLPLFLWRWLVGTARGKRTPAY